MMKQRILFLIAVFFSTLLVAQTPTYYLPVGYDRANHESIDGAHVPFSDRILPDRMQTVRSDFSEGFDDILLLPGLGWALINNSDPLGISGWFQGNPGVFAAHSGAVDSYIGANFNNTAGVGTISNWLLTPEVTMNDGDVISFWTRTTSGSMWADRVQVRLSTSGSSTNVGTSATDVGDFTTLLLDINSELISVGYPGLWTNYTITLTGIGTDAAGRIAFRYYVPNGGPDGSNSNYIGIDTFSYTTNGDDPPLPPDAGEDCTNPIVVDALPFQDLNQTTCGMGNTYSNTCLGNYDIGEDIHYEFTITEEQLVTITMDPKGTSWTGMLLTDVCPPPGTGCIATSTGSGGIRTIQEVLDPGTYYIMISTWPTPVCIPDFDLTITAEDPPPYCLGGPTSTADSNVENVSILGENGTEIDYDGNCPGVTGVEDLTDLVVELYPGETYTLYVTFGTCGGNWSGAGSVWVDWDQDFEFNPGDLIHESVGTPGSGLWDGPVEITFTVPNDAEPGNTVMRVMQWEDSFSFPAELPLDPCATFTWGSVMDFGITILDEAPVVIPPCAFNPQPAHGAVGVDIDGTMSWTGSPEADGYRLYVGTPPDTWNIVNGLDLGAATSYGYSGLNYSTAYAWAVVPYNEAGDAEDCLVWVFTTMFEPDDDDDEPPLDVPVGSWVLYLTVLMIAVFIFVRVRKIM